MKRKRLNFKQRDYITGELKNVGGVEMRNADEPEEPEEMPEEEKEPEEEPGAPVVIPPGSEEEPEEEQADQ